jgi:NAD(P)-dependent dehydrogenase (short-subunit alcohol dehydrogenase family)
MVGSNSAFLALINEIAVKAISQGNEMTVLNPTQPLQGQRALVIRSDSPIGAVIAEALAEAGAKVMLNYLDEREQAEQVAQRIRAKQGQAMIFQADVTQEAQVKSMFDVLIGYWGSIDILVTNASLELAPLLEMSLEQWQQNICKHLTEHFLCAREASREFLRRGLAPELSYAVGKIICVSVEHRCIYQSEYIDYAAYNSGMGLLMKSIAQPFYQDVRSIASISRAFEATDKDSSVNLEAIAHRVVWLASNESKAVDGFNLSVQPEIAVMNFRFQRDALVDLSSQGKL